MSPRGAYRWDEIDPATPLGRLVAPHCWIIDEDDPYSEQTALDAHLLADGLIQLTNPGFDGHYLGIGLVPWYGFGHCALLAWHLHRVTGLPLTSLVATDGTRGHTGVRSAGGLILDWRDANDASGAAAEYVSMHGTQMAWIQDTPEQWIDQWLPGGDPAVIEVGGHQHPAPIYDEFELLLTDHLARMIASSAGIAVRDLHGAAS